MRELAVENAVKIMSRLGPEEATRLFGSFVDNLQNETSRSMRISKAKYFVELAKAMHPFRPIQSQVSRAVNSRKESRARQEAY